MERSENGAAQLCYSAGEGERSVAAMQRAVRQPGGALCLLVLVVHHLLDGQLNTRPANR